MKIGHTSPCANGPNFLHVLHVCTLKLTSEVMLDRSRQSQHGYDLPQLGGHCGALLVRKGKEAGIPGEAVLNGEYVPLAFILIKRAHQVEAPEAVRVGWRLSGEGSLLQVSPGGPQSAVNAAEMESLHGVVQGGIVKMAAHPLKGGMEPGVGAGSCLMEHWPHLQDGLGGDHYLALGTAINVLIFSHQ